MISRFCFYTLVIVILSLSIGYLRGSNPVNTFYLADSVKKKDTLPSYFGISYIPSLNWKVAFMNHKEIGRPLLLNFDITTMTTIEGNFRIRKIGMKLGIMAQMDNNLIGKFYQWSGYLGYRSFMLKLQNARISGKYDWTGLLPDGMGYPVYKSSGNFTSKFFNIDLIKIVKKKRLIDGKWVVEPVESQMGFYWGIGYISLGYPVEISTLVTNSDAQHMKFGIPAFDTLYEVKTYNICGGFDLLRQVCLTGGKYGMDPKKPAMRFAMYASTEDKLGFGKGKLSDYSANMCEALNPGKKLISKTDFIAMVHYNLSVGFRYIIKTKPAAIIIAAGYELDGAMVAPFSSGPENNTELGTDFLNVYYNHGIVVKMYISWFGRKH